MTELITAAIMMSVLKKGSRNASDNERESDESADTVDEIMRKIDENSSEKLKIRSVNVSIVRSGHPKIAEKQHIFIMLPERSL